MPETILQEAQRLVHGDRQQDYGHPIDDFTRTAQMWSAILGVDVSAEQVGLCMCAVKISRQCNRPKRDNLTDLAGYAATVQMVLEERERRAEISKPLMIVMERPELPGASMYPAARVGEGETLMEGGE